MKIMNIVKTSKKWWEKKSDEKCKKEPIKAEEYNKWNKNALEKKKSRIGDVEQIRMLERRVVEITQAK